MIEVVTQRFVFLLPNSPFTKLQREKPLNDGGEELNERTRLMGEVHAGYRHKDQQATTRPEGNDGHETTLAGMRRDSLSRLASHQPQ